MRRGFFSQVFHQTNSATNHDHLDQESEDVYELADFKESDEDKDIIPLVWGRARVSGRLIWHGDSVNADPKIASFAIGICEGPITSINNIYVNNQKKIFKSDECCKYLGTLDQDMDPFILQSLEKVPAFRGLAYVVFYNFSLEQFNGEIPQFSFDVSSLLFEHKNRVGKITAVNVIPGCGEFVYDTRLLYKQDHREGMQFSTRGKSPKYRINYMHQATVSNSEANLAFLQQELPGVKWVAPVVCWFGDSLDIKNCKILPRVEYEEGVADVFDEIDNNVEWMVAGYSRAEVPKLALGNDAVIRYGGTVSDESVVAYLQLLRSKGYKIMFYPMLFIDEDAKPWRGHMYGNASQVEDFFRHNGYNAFIEHYANLVKDYVDAFVIGSELEGITSIFSENHGTRKFPAAEELIRLAKRVKDIFSHRDIKVTYAANWSEYHSKEGWYNLDQLWMCDAIDFIGIDVYFPATKTHDSDISYQDIKNGYTTGETYEYYEANGVRKYCDPSFALKNIEYWWQNQHINPDGTKSAWIPQKKKIWFTEFGFASIDKSTNEPNVFFDHSSKDGGIPKFSSGETDFAMQEEAICALIDHFRLVPNMIEEMFLWCWDARYPAWPHSISDFQELFVQDKAYLQSPEEIECFWSDSGNWRRGHWVNGKLSCVSIGEILHEIFLKYDFPSFVIDPNLQGLISGVNLNDSIDGIYLVEMLRLRYQFDLFLNAEGVLHVISRNTGIEDKKSDPVKILSFDDLRFALNAPSIKFAQSSESLGVVLYFICENDDEENGEGAVFTKISINPNCSVRMKLPISMSFSRAYSAANKMRNSMNENNSLCTLQVPFFFEATPTDLIALQLSKGETILLRIISVNFYHREKELICVRVS